MIPMGQWKVVSEQVKEKWGLWVMSSKCILDAL
jgi:hypothetical protein